MTEPTPIVAAPAVAGAAQLHLEVELAHHLEWPRDSGYHYLPLDKLVVTRDQGVELAAAGYLTCDPSQADQVARALANETDAELTADTQADAALDSGQAPAGRPDETWTRPALQAFLREAELPASGSNAALLERAQEHYDTPAGELEPAE